MALVAETVERAGWRDKVIAAPSGGTIKQNQVHVSGNKPGARQCQSPIVANGGAAIEPILRLGYPNMLINIAQFEEFGLCPARTIGKVRSKNEGGS